LNEAVLERVSASDTTRCRIFPSEDGMKRCAEYIRQRIHDDSPIRELSFSLPQKRPSDQNMIWARFSAVLFPEQHREHADEEWDYIGEGISSRHAEFCLERFSFMESTSSDASLQTRATSLKQTIPLQSWGESDILIKNALKAKIAKYATSQKSGQGMIDPYDVFLYPRGMSAIGAVARLLAPSFSSDSEAVVFG
jgi:cystathionine gamma-synthase